jgi:formylglycine-generating enzyme required for sulfatase activity
MYEASPGADCPFVNIQSQADTIENIDSGDCVPVSVSGQEPWRFISRDQAAWACSKAGKRLLSSSEWQQASYGTPDEKDNCQTDNNWDKQPGLTGTAPECISSSGAYDMIGNVWEWVSDTVNDGSLNGEKLANSGYVKGIGNNSLAVISSEDGQVNYNNDYFWIKQSGQKAVARGGYWDSQERGGIFSAYVVAPPDQAEVGIGFRCAR